MPEATKTTTPAGWGFPTMTARKAHFFREGEGRSLCGKYGNFGIHLEPDTGRPSASDCVACSRKKEATRG